MHSFLAYQHGMMYPKTATTNALGNTLRKALIPTNSAGSWSGHILTIHQSC